MKSTLESADAVFESVPILKTITLANTTSATTTATKRITPITGDTPFYFLYIYTYLSCIYITIIQGYMFYLVEIDM